MQEPRPGGSDPYRQTTQLYLDVHVALEYLHCTYSEYVLRVPMAERLLYQYYLMLKAAKEEHAYEEQQREMEAAQAAQAGPEPGMLGGRP